MNKIRIMLLTGCLSLPMLSACTWFKQDPVYPNAKSVPEIEVPQDQSKPDASSAMLVPEGDLSGTYHENLIYPPDAMSTRLTLNNSAEDQLSILVEDEIESVWRRVGLAIPRSGLAQNASSQSNWRYDVVYSESRKIERGLFSKVALFWKPSQETIRYPLIIQLEPAGKDTRLKIEKTDNQPGSTEAANKVLKIMQQRLG